MSQARFEAELLPGRRLRFCLLSFACGATILGAILILLLPIVPALQGTFLILWSLTGSLEVRAEWAGMSRIERIRIREDGRVHGYGGSESEYPLHLLPGSVVLGRAAWLRMRFPDGLCYGELVTAGGCGSEQWRRLRVIWRHPAPVFGRPR